MEAGLGETKESREYKVETENDTVIPAKASNWKTNHNEASPGLVCPRNRRLGRENMGNDQGSSGCPNLGVWTCQKYGSWRRKDRFIRDARIESFLSSFHPPFGPSSPRVMACVVRSLILLRPLASLPTLFTRGGHGLTSLSLPDFDVLLRCVLDISLRRSKPQDPVGR